MLKTLILFFFMPLSLFAQWTQVSSLPSTFQSDHSFGFAINNTGYLVTGNVLDQFGLPISVDDFYSYSPDTDTWTQLDDFPGGRRGYAIGDVWNNKAYLGFGLGVNGTTGFEEYRNDLWEFDPATSSWTELTSCPCLARTHPAFLTHQGNIYVGLGGSSIGNLNDWWQYNIATDTWTAKADFPSHERHHPYQFAIGDYVYVGFGHGTQGDVIYDAWYRYNPSDNTWLEVQNLPAEGRVAGTQFSHGEYGYVLSGDGDDHASMTSGEFWKYDAVTDGWEQMPSHPGDSRWAPASFILDDHIYIVNGSSFGIYQSEVYKFSLSEDPLNVDEIDNAIDMTVSPNPFSNQVAITVNSEHHNQNDLSIKVNNVLGQVVLETLVSNLSSLSLGKLSSGTYFLQLYNNQKLLVHKKIVKE